MRLTQISLRNFKAIRAADIRPAALTVLIGRNNSGKSSILHALALLAQSANNPNQITTSGWIDLGSDLQELISLGASRTEGWTIQLLWTDNLPASDPIGPGQPVVIGFELHVPASTPPWSRIWVEVQSPPPRKVTLSARSDSNELVIQADDLRDATGRVMQGFQDKRQIGSGQLWRYGIGYSAVMPAFESGTVADAQNVASRNYPVEIAARYLQQGIVDALTQFQYIGPSRQFLHAQMGLRGQMPATIATAEDVAAAMAYRRNLERRVSERCRRIFHYGVEILNVPGNVAIAAVDESDRTVNAVNMGSGFNQIAWMATVLESRLIAQESQGATFAAVGIEEPELHLHPAAQSQVADVLRIYAASGVQILATTHSEHLLKALLRLVLGGQLEESQISVLYVEDGKVESLPVDDWGRVQGGLKGFFDVTEQELGEHLDLLIDKKGSNQP